MAPACQCPMGTWRCYRYYRCRSTLATPGCLPAPIASRSFLRFQVVGQNKENAFKWGCSLHKDSCVFCVRARVRTCVANAGLGLRPLSGPPWRVLTWYLEVEAHAPTGAVRPVRRLVWSDRIRLDRIRSDQVSIDESRLGEVKSAPVSMMR